MKNLLVINPIPLICSIKKLIFVFILLLILPFSGCKSVVKETIVYPNGGKYVGEIESGEPHGQGTFTLPDGAKYVGEWKNGIQDGQGTLSYPDGRKYVGEFKNGIQNGQGTNTFSNGWNGIGEWIDVEPWNIKVFDKKGNLKMKWENGKVQYF